LGIEQLAEDHSGSLKITTDNFTPAMVGGGFLAKIAAPAGPGA
jgi:hypothetical protein